MTEPTLDPRTSRPAPGSVPSRRGLSAKWGWIAGFVIMALIAIFVFTRSTYQAATTNTSTGAPPATSNAPTPSGASIPPSVTSQPPASGQPSPQGPTGPINTGSGGAPANSPQGETPPAMQSAPQGAQQPAPPGQPR